MKILLFLAVLQITLFARTFNVVDADIGPTNKTVNWTTGDTAILKEAVIVDSGCVLNIAAGVVIKADLMPSEPDMYTMISLIIAPGGKIHALGTKNAPIIMTSVLDTTKRLPVGTIGTINPDVSGLWGGLVILGRAKIAKTGGVYHIFGPEYRYDTQQKSYWYGGNNDEDSSGVLRFVSIRYGGSVPRDIDYADEWTAGITLAGVGRKTVVDNVEIFNAGATSAHLLGGTVNCKHIAVHKLATSIVSSNPIVIKEGWRGTGMYWLVWGLGGLNNCIQFIKGDTINGFPNEKALIANATIAGGTYSVISNPTVNVVFVNTCFNSSEKGLKITNYKSTDPIKFYNNTFSSVDGSRLPYWETAICVGEESLRSHLDSANSLTQYTTISKYTGNPGEMRIDFRLFNDSTITYCFKNYNIVKDFPFLMKNDIYDTLNSRGLFKGAFDPSLHSDSSWLSGWSVLEYHRMLKKDSGAIFTTLPEKVNPKDVGVSQVPMSHQSSLFNVSSISGGSILAHINAPAHQKATIDFYNVQGKKIKEAVSPFQTRSGTTSISISTTGLSAGVYFLKLNLPNRSVARKAVVLR